MSLILDGKTIVGPGNSPYIGENGHWWSGYIDLGVDAGPDMHYLTIEEFKVADEEGIYFVYDEPKNEITVWHIDDECKKWVVSDKDIVIPHVGPNGNWFIGDTDIGISTNQDIKGGAAIDDSSVNGSTVWSSKKVKDEMQKMHDQGIPGKNLEFQWVKTKLGIRQEGAPEYEYRDLVGPTGPTGLDGSSVVDAVIEGTDLILTIQDDDYPMEDNKILDIEKGFLTAKDFKDLVNEITRINSELSNIKKSNFREYVGYGTDTDSEYDTILTLDGTGYCQFLVSPFEGSIRITIDGVSYTKDIDKQVSANMKDCNLISLDINNEITVNEMFALNFTQSLDIRYNKYMTVELLVAESSSYPYPKLVFQGSNYKASTYSGEGIGNPEGGEGMPQIMTERDVDIMMGLITESHTSRIMASSMFSDKIGSINL